MLQKHVVKILLLLTLVIVVLAALAFIFRDQIERWFLRPTESSLPVSRPDQFGKASAVAKNLATPWAIGFSPNGDLLVSQRGGQLQRIGDNGQRYQVDGVSAVGEGGLLGLALHPDFESNQFVYLYSTTGSGDQLTNRIERYRLQSDRLTDRQIILADIPAAINHDGGSLAFGPDGKLYVTTGDAADPDSAQDKTALSGKILRLNDDGSVPTDNPFKNQVWSYGHRNVQGITWDDQGRLWATEHGPSGSQSGFDELNLVEKGVNYGWPAVRGDEQQTGMRRPVAHSGSDETWAPGGIAYRNGSLYFAGLRGETLYQAIIQDNAGVELSRHFSGKYGRLRAVAIRGNDLFMSTSNTDGRGAPKSDDDQVLRVKLNQR